MRSLTIENDTHWRTSDIQRIVRLCMTAGHADPTERRVVRVMYTARPPKQRKTKQPLKKPRVLKENECSDPSVLRIRFYSTPALTSVNKPPHKVLRGEFKGEVVTTEIGIYVPKRGRQDPHPVAMVALAAEAAVADQIEEDTTLLPFSDVYYMANYLSAKFAAESLFLYDDEDEAIKETYQALWGDRHEVGPPDCVPCDKLFIAKYKDPKKDSAFVAFLQKKEAAVKRWETTAENLEGEITKLKRRLADAQRRKKAAEKAIRDAHARRT